MGRIFIYLVMILMLACSCSRSKRHLTISKIKSTAKLATTETIIDKTVIGGKSKRVMGIINISNAEFVAYTQATVKTGVDLNKLKKGDIKIERNSIEIKLPMVQVLEFLYPFDKFKIDYFLSDDDLFNRIDVVEQEYFYRQAEIDIRKHLEYIGIKEKTEANTRKMMESLLKNLGYNEIYITFSDSGEFITQVDVQ